MIQGQTNVIQVLLLLLMQQGPVDAGVPLKWSGGSRIKARFATDGTGGEQFLGWYDSKLQIDCELWNTGDGSIRCVPTERISVLDGLFADHACSRPALQRLEVGLGGCTSAPRYTTIIDDSCPPRFRVVEVGAPIHPDRLFQLNDKRCEEFATDNRPPVYARGRELKPSELVEVKVKKPSGRAGVGAATLELTDGARGFRLHDLDGGYECTPFLSSDGSTRCLPWEVVARNGAHWGCTQRFGVESRKTGCGATPLLQRAQTFEWDFFEVEKTREGDLTFGAPVPRSRFVAATEHSAMAAAQPRLELFLATWPGGVTISAGWGDSVLGTRCLAERSTDGTLRCVPLTSTSVTGIYADASCTVRLALAPTNDCVPAFAMEYVDGCDTRVRIYRLGARHQGPVWSTAFGGKCSSMNDPRAYYLLGAEVPPDAMAPLTEVKR